jgi:cytoskeletal protein CcmA (bactofilin family)
MLKSNDHASRAEGVTTSRGLFGRSSASSTNAASASLSTVHKTPVAASPVAASPVSPAPANVATPSASAVSPAPTFPRSAEGETGNRLLVGPDVKLKGAEILDCDTLVVEGRVEATMDSHLIRIAEQGIFCGKVSIDTAEIHGSFEGELTARGQLIVHATGRVTGKIRYGKILIEEGGQICGDVQSIGSEPHVVPLKTEMRAETRAEVRSLEAVAPHA